MVNENVSLVVSRLILRDVATALSSMNDDVSQDIASYTLEKVRLNSHLYCFSDKQRE